MSRLVYDGNYHAYWLDAAPASATAPTMAEITAGTDITVFLTKDGFNPNVTNNRVTGGDLSTKFTDQSMGTWTAEGSLTFYLDAASGGNTAWDTLGDFATGCLIITPFAAAASGGSAYVFPDVELGVRAIQQTAENARQKATVNFACRQEPALDATVAA